MHSHCDTIRTVRATRRCNRQREPAHVEVLIVEWGSGSGDKTVKNRRTRSLIKPGDQVKVSARGKFVVTVKDIDEDSGLAMIEVNADSPLTYPWPYNVSRPWEDYLCALAPARGRSPRSPFSH
ncbi:hypothetical protein Y013_25280 (plasmid) [Rhodococcus pyridinivorans SB3094]|uniref:Uncharacterized protein n=1 Tax=Rhodococcus pyridinivorans SB3094 TaxID=1435356 RepID=V9XPH3_9NOCA|nr:hypothetical protein Y013_25280 [Rhodococcus pyridinivorans SB3094]